MVSLPVTTRRRRHQGNIDNSLAAARLRIALKWAHPVGEKLVYAGGGLVTRLSPAPVMSE